MDVDAALSEVPVNILPLIDDTDFKSREVALTYDQAGMDLVWNFVTTTGAFTQTAVTPTTGGNYDWTHQGDGMYTIEIPASGGASINNDTEGFGWFTGYCTGVLPWRGPIIGFRAAGINDKLIESAYSATRGLAGTALPDAVADAAGGLPISDLGELDLDTKLAATNEITAARMGALTDWIDGGRLDLILDGILEDTGTTIPGTITTIDGIVDDILVDTGTTLNALILDIPTVAEFNARTTADPATATNQSTIIGYIDTEIGAIITHLTDIKGGTFSGVTDSLEAIRDRGDAAWITATGFSTLDATGVRTAVGLATANLDTQLADVPTVAEFNARTLVAASYFDPAVDVVAHVTLVDTTTTNTDMVAAAPTTGEIKTAIEAAGSHLALILEDTSTTIPGTITTIDGIVDAILLDTAELQSDWVNGGRLDLILDGRASPADVNTQVLDVLQTDTFAEPGQGDPSATTSLINKIGYLFKSWRNKMTNDGTDVKLYADDGTTVDQKASVTEVGGTVTRGKFGTGA
jgi:hypothetical protein